MYEVIQCYYEELPEEVNKEWGLSDNGSGKDCATYIIQKADGEIISVESDAMEPEDASFGRDLKWIKQSLEDAYEKGLEDGGLNDWDIEYEPMIKHKHKIVELKTTVEFGGRYPHPPLGRDDNH